MFILRSTKTFCSLTALVVFAAVSNAQTTARPGADTAEIRSARPARQPDPQLWKLLLDWERGSAAIKTLQGRHQRRIYDDTFKVEKLAHGEFWYGNPDKGRIDISKIRITEKMIAARNAPGAKVERDKVTGKPYKLQSDDDRRWICDGARLFDIDDNRKEARITNLPPDSRGENIMNTPLPFLFGMPPNKALERYDISISDLNTSAKPPYALLSISPRWQRDARNWKRAQVYLNTESYLPIAVKLIDPAETRRTVYTFFEPKINKWRIPLTKKPWEPKLTGYQVNVIDAGGAEPGKDQKAARPVAGIVPNVVGMPHNEAQKVLVLAGVKKADIELFQGKPAPNQALTYHVSQQIPAPGTPVTAQTKAKLQIYLPHQQGAVGVKPAGAKVRQ